jgi:hypothetical protein
MADSPYVHVLNDFGGVRFEERERKSGKKHVTISVTSTPISVHLDPLALGKPMAEVIAKAIADGIRAIRETASAETLLKRKYAATAFAAGKRWAVARYSGGRTGAKPPRPENDRLFNDSGRLADGIIAMPNAKEQAWTVNTTANRLDRSTFSGGAFERMIQRLAELVPALRGNPLELPEVRAAQDDLWATMHVKHAMDVAGKRSEQIAKGLREGLRLVRDLVT